MGTEGGNDDTREIARLRGLLEAERRTSEQWRRVAEERRVAMERLRQRRVVRFVLSLAKVLMPGLHRFRRAAGRLERAARRLASGLLGARHRLTAPHRERVLRRAVSGLADAPTDQRTVAAVVLTRDGRENLERLLPRLRTCRHPLRVVVVDNASGPDTSVWLDEQPGVEVMRNATNMTFAAANNRAVEQLDEDIVLFLNDDIEPLDDQWVGRMLAALAPPVAAVGAMLVYPRRGFFEGRARDVSVQHRGITLDVVDDGPVEVSHAGRHDDVTCADGDREVFAATAACLLVDRSAFVRVGGFDEGYQWGAEDVDLCARLRKQGGTVKVATGSVLWHHEGATRHREKSDILAKRQAANWQRFEELWGPELRRTAQQDRVSGESILCERPFEVAITITRDLESAGYGDYHTAHGLGAELARIGWQVTYLERYRDAWYDVPASVDAIIVLHDLFDIRKVQRPGRTTIAWVRNWVERWLSHPWFDELDLVVASSEQAAEEIVQGSRQVNVDVLPLAVDSDRFLPGGVARRGVVLTANHWGEDRGIEPIVAAVDDLALYGKGWDQVPAVASAWKGSVSHEELAGLYARTQIVVDQTAAPTRRHGFVNSRVFEAVAAGAYVLTDMEAARELLGDGVGVYESPTHLADLVRKALADATATEMAAHASRERLLRDHTYRCRAEYFQGLLAAHVQRPSVVVRTSAPSQKEARNWGDTFFAESFTAELRARGIRTLVQTIDEWSDRRGRGYDVSLHLRGRSHATVTPAQVAAVWVISHPEEVDHYSLADADLVFVASDRLARELGRHRSDVHVLLQATDERRFFSRNASDEFAHDVVFVGNSRFVRRPLVMAAVDAGLPVTIYGANWDRYVLPSTIAARFVDNEQVGEIYSSSRVVLNDHWPEMREAGLVSNRVFDVLASGGCLVSDDLPELESLFGEAVATVDEDGLADTVRELLSDSVRRRTMGEQGRQIVLAGHTFAHRADTFLSVLAEHTSRPDGPTTGNL